MLKNRETDNKNNRYFFNLLTSYIFASVTSISIFFIGNNPHILPKIKVLYENTNILFFVASIFVFCVTFFVCYLIMQKIKTKDITSIAVSDDTARTVVSVLILFFTFLIWLMCIKSTSMLGYAEINKLPAMNILFVLLAICLMAYSMRKLLLKIDIKSKLFWIVLAILAASLTAYFFYAPNSFMYVYDFNAYYNSIYMHFQGMPFSDNFLSIYGHYAIILKPIFLLVGLTPYTLATTTAMVGFVSIISVIYVMYSLIRNSLIRLFGILVIMFPFAGFLPSQYPQAYPHRLLFPSLMMALAVMLFRNEKRRRILLIGYLLSSLAIIWNNDTGLICLAAWGMLHTYTIITKNQFRISTLVKILVPIYLMASSFFAAWGLVNIYNVATGGGYIDLYHFLFPMLEKSYMYGILHAEMPMYATFWIPMLLILLFFIGYAIAYLPFFTKDQLPKQRPSLILFIAILGLGQFVYFINRCAYYNILLGYYEAILLLLLLSQLTINSMIIKTANIKSVIKKVVFCCVMMSIIGMSLILIINIGTKIKYMSINNNTTDIVSVSNYYKKFAEKDTPIISIRTASLGVALGWKNELDFIDLSDLFLSQHKEYIIHRLVNYKKPFIIETRYIKSLQGTVCVNYKNDCDKFKHIEDFYFASQVEQPIESLYKYYDASVIPQQMTWLQPK